MEELEKLVLGARLLFIIIVVAIVAVAFWIFWIAMLLKRWLRERKRKREEPKKELKKFILAVSNGDTIKFARELSSEAEEKDIKQAMKECQKDFGEDWEMYYKEAESRDSAIFELTDQLRAKILSQSP